MKNDPMQVKDARERLRRAGYIETARSSPKKDIMILDRLLQEGTLPQMQDKQEQEQKHAQQED